MFTITYNWTFLSLHIFAEVKLDLVPFSFFTSFESDFDTTPFPVPITTNGYRQKPQGH